MNRLNLIFRCCSVWLLLLSGCSSFRIEMGQPVQATGGEFTARETRVETVVHKIGPPNSATRLPHGFAFLYEYSRVNEFQVGINVPYSFLRYLKFIHAWNHLDHEAFALIFDDRGVLQDAGRRQWREKLGGGNAVQIVFNVMSLSDVSKLLRPADAHTWGQRLLQPLPVALNSGQSLRTGENGLQQRIAPNYAGQQTLEMTKPKTENEKRRIKRDYQHPK